MRLPPDASQIVTQTVKASARVGDERKIFMLILRGMQSLFSCRAGSIFIYRRSEARLDKVKAIGDAAWDETTLMSFYRNLKPELPADSIMAPIRMGNEVIGVMVLLKDGPFEKGAGMVATEVLKVIGGVLGDRQRIKVLEAEAAIARSIVAGLDPKDVTYRIFHQLRRFVDYDHSATLWRRVDESEGQVVARQVAWAKGRSGIVGMTAALAWDDFAGLPGPVILGGGVGPGPEANDGGKRIWDSICSLSEPSEPPQQSALIGQLSAGDRPLGCVVLASEQADFFVDKDKWLLSRFQMYLSWCIDQLHTNRGGCHE